jgi:hypothetical protein
MLDLYPDLQVAVSILANVDLSGRAGGWPDH